MRRGNKSHKVPNVKLRPAQPKPRYSQARDQDASCDRSSDSEMPPNPSMVDLCPRPFKGFTICATGTMDKPTLFKMAFELGATSTSDFTDRVTHLVASAHGGAKYLCALEHRIPIMTLEWISEAHAIWLRGDDVDVEQSISTHRLPIFSGVILSLSGIEDVKMRTQINRLVTSHQGTYVKNLERPVRVTHLLCSGDTETDKMKYAEKFNKRKEANIHLVWEEWFWDSLEYGGRFDEKKYQVGRPRPERKPTHEIPAASLHVQNTVPSSGFHPVDVVDQSKRANPAVPTGSFTVINNLHVDDDEEEMAIVNKPVPAVTLQLWQSLLKPRGFELEGGRLVQSPSKSQVTRSPPSTPTRPPARHNGTNRLQPAKEKESVISSFRRTHSFAPVPAKESSVRQPFRRNATCPVVCPSEAEGSGLRDAIQPEGDLAMPTLFAGYTFRLLGEARCPNVRSAIEHGGGVVTDDDVEDPSFYIVRLISGSKLYHDEFDDHARTKYRTECWLEHSVFHERICGPDENVSFTPLKVAMPVSDAEKIKLSLSGLDQSELCWIRRLARAIGMTLEPTFSRRSTHLLCPSGTGAKFDKALEWRIPVVSLAWLENIAQTGAITSVDEYLVGGSHGFSLDPISEVKKGKEREVDYQMTDITDDDPTAQLPIFVKSAGLLQDAVLPLESDARRHRDQALERRSPPSFGKPRFLMHDSDPPEEEGQGHGTSSPPAAPPSSSSPPPPAEAELPLFAPTPPLALASPVLPRQLGLSRPVRRSPAAPQKGQSPVRTRPPGPTPARAHAGARIPSSTSPSPMKLLLPSSSLPDAFAPSSPARLPDTDAITKALHESLTSLLGKRPIAEEEAAAADRDASGAGAAAAAAAAAGGGGPKKGKRARPGGGGPSNFSSRTTSRENVVSPSRPPLAMSLSLSLLDGHDNDNDNDHGDGGGVLGRGALRSTEESMQVTYEDPGQAEEKRRLWRMLGAGEEDGREAPRASVGDGGVGGGVTLALGNGMGRPRTKRIKVVPGRYCKT